MRNSLLPFILFFSLIFSITASDGIQEPVFLPTPELIVSDSNRMPDSLKRSIKRDSLIALETNRRTNYYPNAPQSTQQFKSNLIDSRTFFTADATSWYDLPELKHLFVSPRMGIAGTTNRLLFYGNSFPANRLFVGNKLLLGKTICSSAQTHDSYFMNEFSSVVIAKNGDFYFTPFSVDSLITPESVLFWENGPFNEKILSIRFTRPLSRNAMVNIFTNYRFFEATEFNHDQNDIYNFFSSITPDTTLLSNEGYNPLVNEFHCGAEVAWKNRTSNSRCKIKYSDLSNEIPLNQSDTGSIPAYAKLTHYPLALHYAYDTKVNRYYNLEIEGSFVSNTQLWNRTVIQGQKKVPEQKKLSTDDYTGAIRNTMTPLSHDTIAFTLHGRRIRSDVPDSVNVLLYEVQPEAMWNRPVTSGIFEGKATISTGYDIVAHDLNKQAFCWYAAFSALITGNTITIYTEKDHRYLMPHYDSLSLSPVAYNSYIRSGIDIARRWSKASIYTGYQFYHDDDLAMTTRAWANGMPPYQQPMSVFVAASDIGRFFGSALSSRIMISDTRPYLKLNCVLSYIVLPSLTREAIDVRLGLDYWSMRDKTVFAGRSDWNRAIVDINTTTSVHIKSFRLFYKIDNMLNRKFSYIPGYESPGITFRWGLNWFIQR